MIFFFFDNLHDPVQYNNKLQQVVTCPHSFGNSISIRERYLEPPKTRWASFPLEERPPVLIVLLQTENRVVVIFSAPAQFRTHARTELGILSCDLIRGGASTQSLP